MIIRNFLMSVSWSSYDYNDDCERKKRRNVSVTAVGGGRSIDPGLIARDPGPVAVCHGRVTVTAAAAWRWLQSIVVARCAAWLTAFRQLGAAIERHFVFNNKRATGQLTTCQRSRCNLWLTKVHALKFNWKSIQIGIWLRLKLGNSLDYRLSKIQLKFLNQSCSLMIHLKWATTVAIRPNSAIRRIPRSPLYLILLVHIVYLILINNCWWRAQRHVIQSADSIGSIQFLEANASE